MIEDITFLYCFIDDFCKERGKEIQRYLIENGTKIRKPTRVPGLTLSEIITIIVFFYQSKCRTFKHFYQYLEEHHKRDFPKMPSYERFIILKKRIVPILSDLFHCILSKDTTYAYIDSTALRVCHNKRTGSHMVFK